MNLLLALSLSHPATAGDSWTNIRPGVDYLHRTTSDPQDIYAVRVDLSVPNVGLHASSDTDGRERHTTTPTFASSSGSLVAINGDWSDGSTPVGLAISDGWQWHDHIHDDTLGGQWGFLACTIQKDCTLSTELPLDQAWWFSTPTIAPYRYFQAIGANGIPMLVGGAAASGCYDTAANPRSAACIDSTGTMLWLLAIDGRTSSATGMTCDQVRQLMLELDCWDGVMLDGGGSTTLVIEGDVVNNPSDGSPRTVANHLGITYADALDPACVEPNGKWCDGTSIYACQGGRYLGGGDCAVYGASCEEAGDYAYCVDYRCPGGSGQGTQCVDATNLAACVDGAYGIGDCGAFGLACGTDAQGAGCMDPRCEAGPHSAFCTDTGLYAVCTDGVYSEGDCGVYGLVCWESETTAACVDPHCAADPEADTCTTGGVYSSCTAGVYAEQDCAATGQTCDPALGCTGGDDNGGNNGGNNGGGTGGGNAADSGGNAEVVSGDEGCGCAGTSGPPGFGGVVLGGALFAVRRRRRA